jgi:hypothetical protein
MPGMPGMQGIPGMPGVQPPTPRRRPATAVTPPIAIPPLPTEEPAAPGEGAGETPEPAEEPGSGETAE